MSRQVRKKDCPIERPNKPHSYTAKGACHVCHLQKKEFVGYDDTHNTYCPGPCLDWKTCRVTYFHPEVTEKHRADLKKYEQEVDKWVENEKQKLARLKVDRAASSPKQSAANRVQESKETDRNQTMLHAPEIETALHQIFTPQMKQVAQPILLDALLQYTRGEPSLEPNQKKRKVLRLQKKIWIWSNEFKDYSTQ